MSTVFDGRGGGVRFISVIDLEVLEECRVKLFQGSSKAIPDL